MKVVLLNDIKWNGLLIMSFFVKINTSASKYYSSNDVELWIAAHSTWVRFPPFWKLSSPIFLTIDCKAYSKNILKTSIIRCLLSQINLSFVLMVWYGVSLKKSTNWLLPSKSTLKCFSQSDASVFQSKSGYHSHF